MASYTEREFGTTYYDEMLLRVAPEEECYLNELCIVVILDDL